MSWLRRGTGRPATARRLRIAFLVTKLHGGGAERQMLMLARELRPTHDVVFVAMRPGGSFTGIPAELGIEVRQLGWANGRWQDAPARHLFGMVRAFTRYLRIAREVDVIDAWMPGAYTFAALAQPLARVPVLVAGRRTMADVARPPGRWRSVGEALATLTTRQARAVVANAEAVARDAISSERLSPASVKVIRNGVDLPPASSARLRRVTRRTWGVSDGDLVVGCVASFRAGKGLEEILAVAQRLQAEPEPVRFALVGDGPLRPAIERRIGELGLERLVILHGEHPDARQVYPAFDIFVQASLSEGLPNAVLEAAAWGRPIVATDVGGTAEIVRHDREGLLVAPRDPDALATALLSLVRDPERRQRLGVAARKRAREFSPRKLANETAALYAELVALRRGEAPAPRRVAPDTTQRCV